MGGTCAEMSFVTEKEGAAKRVLSLNLVISGSEGKVADLFFFRIDDACYAFEPGGFLERFQARSLRDALLAVGEKTRAGEKTLAKLSTSRDAEKYSRCFFSEESLVFEQLPQPLKIKI